MIFKQWQQVLDGTKTQTRRLTKRGQQLTPNRLHTEHTWPFPPTVLENAQIKWMVGKTYAVQPGRGKKAVGRIRITGIRRERLQDISKKDAWAEGIGNPDFDDEISGSCLGGIAGGCDACANCDPVWHFKLLWDSIYTKKGARWKDDPECWCLEFEVVESNER